MLQLGESIRVAVSGDRWPPRPVLSNAGGPVGMVASYWPQLPPQYPQCLEIRALPVAARDARSKARDKAGPARSAAGRDDYMVSRTIWAMKSLAQVTASVTLSMTSKPVAASV